MTLRERRLSRVLWNGASEECRTSRVPGPGGRSVAGVTGLVLSTTTCA